MDTQEVDKLIMRVNTHKANLLKRKKLLKEKEEWHLMLNDVEDMVNELQKQYNKTHSEEDKEKLDEWLKEQKDYLNILDEYTTDINKINIELSVYRDEDYHIELEFLEKIIQYQDNIKKIQDIENVSKKAMLKYNYKLSKGAATMDEYGYKHYILSDFEDTYAQLVYDQKQLSSYLKSNYELIFNGVYEPPVKVEMQPKRDIEPEEDDYDENFDDNDELNVQYHKLQHILNEGKLLVKQEIELIKRFQHNILHKTKTGKKIYEHINGKIIRIPKKFSGYYHNACKWLKDRLKPNVIENTQSNLQLANEEEYVDINEFATHKDDKVLPIEQIKKPNDKKKLKRKLKVIGVVVASAVIAGSALIMTSINDLVKKNNNSKREIKVTEHLEKETLVDKTNDEVNKHIVNKNKDKIVKEDDYELGDIVSTKKGSDIYSNAQDSINHRNGKNPYFASNTKNRITGITLTSKDGIATFVALPNVSDTYEVTIGGQITYLTEKEAEHQIQDMKKQGWKEEGVAVTNLNASNGITGFYNIDEISGGKTR